jgi:hypothetical protein
MVSGGFPGPEDDVTQIGLKHLPGQHSQSDHTPKKYAKGAGRVWTGKQVDERPTVSKLETGLIGEDVARHALSTMMGTEFKTTNVGLNNAPIDAFGDHTAVEIKTGLSSNGRTAQHWRATIGQPGVAEREQIALMNPQEKRQHHTRKRVAIMERKAAVLKEASKEAGAPVKGMTVGVILAPDGSRADVYAIPGFHQRLRWDDYATDEFYVGTYDVGQLTHKHLPGQHDQGDHTPKKYGRAGAGEPVESEYGEYDEYMDSINPGELVANEWDFYVAKGDEPTEAQIVAVQDIVKKLPLNHQARVEKTIIHASEQFVDPDLGTVAGVAHAYRRSVEVTTGWLRKGELRKPQARIVAHEYGHVVMGPDFRGLSTHDAKKLRTTRKDLTGLYDSRMDAAGVDRTRDLMHVETIVQAKDVKAVSYYSKTNRTEFIAESYAYYVTAPKTLKQKDPEAYAIMKDFFDGQEYE